MNDFIIKNLNDFWRFAKRPTDVKSNLSDKDIAKNMLVIFGFELLVVLLFILIISPFEDQLNLDKNMLEDFLKNSPFLFLVLGTFVSPFVEELIFRFFITLRRAFYILWPMYLVGSVFNVKRFTVLKNTVGLWKVIFPFILYLSSISFGLIHLANYENYHDIIWLAPLITFPQLFLGVVLGYTRIKYGFKWGFFLHMVHNALIIIPTVILQMLGVGL